MATYGELCAPESNGSSAILFCTVCLLDKRCVARHGPFLIRLRLNRVSRKSQKGSYLVLEILRVFIRAMRQLVVSAVVRLSPRALLPAAGVQP